MPITDSRLKNGTLSLGTVPVNFETQATNVTIAPDHSQEDGVETLSGDMSEPSLETLYNLNITAIQDFTDPSGFVNYTWDNTGTAVPFTWAPNGASGPSWTGTVQVRAVEVGGDVATQITTEAEFPCIGKPVRTAGAVADAPASASKKG